MLAIGAAFVALRPALPNLMAPVVHYLYQAEWSRYVLMSNRDNLPLDYYLGLSSTLVPYISAVATIVALALIFAVRQVTIRLLGLFALAFVVVFATFSPQFVLQGVQTQIAGLLILFVSNGLLFGVWIGFLAVRCGPQLSVPRLFSLALSLGLAQVTVSGVLLGLIGQLQVLALLAVNLSVCLALAWLTLVRTSDGRMAVTRLVTRVGSCIAVVNSRFGLRFLVLLLLAELGVVCMTNLLVPNLDSDGLVYHLPMVNVMIQNQHIYDVPYHLSEITAYPKTVEMYFLWNTLLPGSHALVDFSQIPFYILLLLSTVELLRGMGRSRDAAIFGGVLTLFFPVVMRQLGTNYIDVAVSALIVSIVSVLHPMLRRGRLVGADRLQVLVLLGLLVGSKGTGPVYAGILGTLYVASAVRCRVPAIGLEIGLTALACAAGSVWWIKNLVSYGNPLFPFRVELGSWRLFDGPLAVTDLHGYAETAGLGLERVLRSWLNVRETSYSSIFGGFGLLWPALFLPCTFVWGIRTLKRVVWADVGIFAVFIALYLVSPVNFRLRFVIFILALGAYCIASCRDSLGSGIGQRSFEWFAVLLALITVVMTPAKGLHDMLVADATRARCTPGRRSRALPPGWVRLMSW